MKIAILSDIHGNALALDAVLESIKEQDCRYIICLGDIAIGGYNGDYCIDKIYGLTLDSKYETKVVAGETEGMLLNYKKKLFFKTAGISPLYKDFIAREAKLIKEDNIDFLNSLPTFLTLTIGEFAIYLCHGTPKNIQEGVTNKTPIMHLENSAKHVNADLIVCAHSHVPCVFYLPSGKAVLNTGSVGMPKTADKRACYAIIDIQNSATGDYTTDVINVDYDIEAAARKIDRLEFPAARAFASQLLNKGE